MHTLHCLNQNENSKVVYNDHFEVTIQIKIILLCVWAEQVILGSDKTALKFKYEI